VEDGIDLGDIIN